MNQYEYLSFYNTYEFEDSLWVNNIVTNDLFRLDKKTLQILEIVDLGLKEYTDQMYPQYFIQMVNYGDSLYLFPSKSTGKILIYNLKTKAIHCQGLGLESLCKEYNELFYKGILYEDCFWIFPPDLEMPLLVYDFGRQKIHFEWKWNENVRALLGSNVSFSLHLAYYENRVYIFQRESAKIIVTDLANGSVDIVSIQSGNNIFSIAADAAYLWIIMEEDSSLYRYDRMDVHKCQIFSLDENKKMHESKPEHRIINLKDKLVAYSPSSDIKSIYVFDKGMGIASKISEEKFPAQLCCLKDFRKGLDYYWGYNVAGRELILYPCNANMILVINVDDISMKGYCTYSYDEELEDYFVKKYRELEYGKKSEPGDLLISRYGMKIIRNILSQPEKING